MGTAPPNVQEGAQVFPMPVGGREPLLMCFARSLSTAPPWLSGCRPRFRDDVTLPGTDWTTANEGSRILSSVSALSLY